MQLVRGSPVAALAAVIAALTVPLAGAIKFFEDVAADQSPVHKVTDLVAKIEANLISDGKIEQQSYDKYMCWCEDTITRKTKNIETAKDQIAKLNELIPKTGAEIASHSAEIAQLKKDIAANQEAQREATEMRATENEAYESSKAESENSIGGLEAAITAMTGAGTKKGFLETMKQAQLISVAADVNRVISSDAATKRVSSEDMEALRRFIEQPGDFIGGGSNKQASALQMAGQSQHPFGDYAPQSGQIQGILKGLYDGFVADMEKDHGDEADKQKSFEELMATKAKELSDLQATLEQHENDEAKKAKLLADSKMERDDTKAQLEADEVFVAETKDGCQAKAKEWAERTRLRTQELLGIGEALKILRDPENQAIFNKAASTFVQLSSKTFSAGSRIAARAHNKLTSLARQLDSRSLLHIAALAKVGGHFDQIMGTIDSRVAELRKEEKEDIEHKDRCESATTRSANDIEDLEHAQLKAKGDIDRLDTTIGDLNQKVINLDGEMTQTDKELAELLDLRNGEVKEFAQALKDDTMAVKIIKSAMAAMAKFYKNNKIAMGLLQGAAEPEYTIDKDKAPETSFDNDEYSGRASESKGALGALEAVVVDIEKEMAVAKKDDADSEAQYEEARAKLVEVREKAEKAKTEAETRVADLKEQKEDKKEHQMEVGQELASTQKLQTTIQQDCAWVASNFDSRRTKRQAEIDGLQEAKDLLSGADSGDYNALSLEAAADK